MIGKLDYNNIELLSPAGSFECAKVAVEAGADAIYRGGAKFGARAFAKSVEENSIAKSIEYVKNNGRKFYLTVNTLFKQKELKEVFLFLDDIVSVGVDAFIVQDLGVAMMLKDKYPDVELHASTQMMITSSKAINLVKSLGFTQVVLARELSIKEIKAIKKEVGDDIKLEAFVHGSMCYCYSGACLMSSFIGGESGNRGRCKGPCRLPYHLNLGTGYIIGKKGTLFNSAKSNTPYILSMKDMCALNSLQGLINAGVTSFKIEGRMRQADYVAGVTKTYRKYLDTIIKDNQTAKVDNNNLTIGANLRSPRKGELCEADIEKDEKYLLELYNKGGFTNYYDKHNGADMIQKYERK
jgi:putative protease